MSRVIEGSLVTRVHRLLASGVLKKRPLWLDVLEAHPPLSGGREERGRAPEISYPEDEMREQFHARYKVKIDKDSMIDSPLTLMETGSHELPMQYRFVEAVVSRVRGGMSETAAVKEAQSHVHRNMRVRSPDPVKPRPAGSSQSTDTPDSLTSTVHSLLGILDKLEHTKK